MTCDVCDGPADVALVQPSDSPIAYTLCAQHLVGFANDLLSTQTGNAPPPEEF